MSYIDFGDIQIQGDPYMVGFDVDGNRDYIDNTIPPEDRINTRLDMNRLLVTNQGDDSYVGLYVRLPFSTKPNIHLNLAQISSYIDTEAKHYNNHRTYLEALFLTTLVSVYAHEVHHLRQDATLQLKKSPLLVKGSLAALPYALVANFAAFYANNNDLLLRLGATQTIQEYACGGLAIAGSVYGLGKGLEAIYRYNLREDTQTEIDAREAEGATSAQNLFSLRRL